MADRRREAWRPAGVGGRLARGRHPPGKVGGLGIGGVIMIMGGSGLIGLYLVLARTGDLRTCLGRFLAIYFASFALYSMVVFVVVRLKPCSWLLLLFIFLCGLAMRVMVIPSRPSLSDDIYRYVWDGKVSAHGINPFRYPPEAPELAFLRDGDYASINHKSLETVYPPFAQGLFFFAHWMGGGVVALKVVLLVFEIGLFVVLLSLLAEEGLAAERVLIYWWNPLVVVEFAHSGHVEPAAMAPFLLGAFLYRKKKWLCSSLAMAISILAKYAGAVFLPFLVLKRRRMTTMIPPALAVVGLGYLPFASAGGKLLASLQRYASTWQFNGWFYTALSSIGLPDPAARIVLAVLLLGTCFLYASRQENIMRYGYWTVGTALLLSPTLHPWYLAWIVPFLVFYPSRAWLLLTGLVVLAYLVLPRYAATGIWILEGRVLIMEYLPFYLLLIGEAAGRRGGSRQLEVQQ